MMEFEPTDEGFIERKIQELVDQPEFGKVTKVFEHTQGDDNSNFECNVKLRDEDKERRRIPIAMPFNGAVAVPEVGDTVLVNFLDGRSQAPVVIGYLHNAVDRAPVGQAGIYRLRKGNLYFEMHPNGDWVRIAKKSGDDGTPSAKIELESDGSINLTGYKLSETDTDTASGDGTQTTFTLSHSFGQVPSTASVTATSADAAGAFYVSNKTDSAVEITYTSAPASGTDNLTYDITTTE